ncbi:histidine kinase [Diaphorobacter nitroreducens]|uniref:sensor histidine kinase n=1 Tax=Diaphorobacter nitroreducens TaxID=164759 RepID=UPI000B599723|nr:histidine kinase [Diaphorobacter nitroreducens]ASI68741.1 histidine kinase [Diaphorobacter nitroreducens]
MSVNHPIAFLCRLLTTAAFCCLVALGVTLARSTPWDANLVYSLTIGLVSWFTVDLGRMALTRHSAIPWPRRPWGAVLIFAGTAMGFVSGSVVGHLYNGGALGDLAWLRGHEAVSTLVVTIAASASISFFFHSRGKARFLQARVAQVQRDAAEARLKLLETQLEPHMMFNTLANLRVLVATDPPRAQEMLDHFIAYLRATLGASRAALHPLADEFARLQDYLALMAVRMGPRLDYTLELPEALHNVPVPPLLLQPLVENAIRHGLEPQVQGGHIHVQAALLQGGTPAARVQLAVRDTGAGLRDTPPAGTAGTTTARFGLQQVRERLATLYGDAGTLELIAASAQGTACIITFPLKHHALDVPPSPDCRG